MGMSHSNPSPNKNPVIGIRGGTTITCEWSGGEVIAVFSMIGLLI
jgi:hypothetical protein